MRGKISIDSFHSSGNWSRCAEERAYESDSELDREFDAIDWRPETPPSVGFAYSSMHDDLNSRPLAGTAPVSCAHGTLPTLSVGDLVTDPIYACSCRHDKHTYTPISERARIRITQVPGKTLPTVSLVRKHLKRDVEPSQLPTTGRSRKPRQC